MAEENTPKLPSTWADVAKSLAEGGLPQIIAGPAGKAISRLVQGVTDIPAAWLNSKAQAIKDESEARTTIMKAVAKASAETAVGDPHLLDRALSRYVADLHRKQENREAVASKAVEELVTSPASVESSGPSDDWLNVFGEYAEKASSEELRQTWGRVLAGEIRKPNSFSLRTLQFLSVLDKPTAEAVETILSCCFEGRYALWESPVQGSLFSQLNLGRLAGVINQVDADTSHTKTFDESGRIVFAFGDVCLVADGEPRADVQIDCSSLSLVGRELYPIIKPSPSEGAISQLVLSLQAEPRVKKIQRGAIIHKNGMIYATQLKTVWDRATPE